MMSDFHVRLYIPGKISSGTPLFERDLTIVYYLYRINLNTVVSSPKARRCCRLGDVVCSLYFLKIAIVFQ